MQFRDPTGDKEPNLEDAVEISGRKSPEGVIEILKEGRKTQQERDSEA